MSVGTYPHIKHDLAEARNLINMSSVMPFVFNAVKLYVVTINEQPWTRARVVCRALEYGKATKATDIVKHLCSRENYVHKYQLNEFVFETKLIDWPNDSSKDDYYVNEKGMYETVFSSQQPKAKRDTAAMSCLMNEDYKKNGKP